MALLMTFPSPTFPSPAQNRHALSRCVPSPRIADFQEQPHARCARVLVDVSADAESVDHRPDGLRHLAFVREVGR